MRSHGSSMAAFPNEPWVIWRLPVAGRSRSVRVSDTEKPFHVRKRVRRVAYVKTHADHPGSRGCGDVVRLIVDKYRPFGGTAERGKPARVGFRRGLAHARGGAIDDAIDVAKDVELEDGRSTVDPFEVIAQNADPLPGGLGFPDHPYRFRPDDKLAIGATGGADPISHLAPPPDEVSQRRGSIAPVIPIADLSFRQRAPQLVACPIDRAAPSP